MAIGDVMRTRVVTVGADDSARLAVLRMLEEGVGSVAVCEGGRLIGIFTERDVLGLAGEGTDLDAVRVGDVMTREPLTVDVGVAVLDAARLMGERKIRHLPVVEGDHLLGMVGIRDVLGSLVERLWQSRDPPRTTRPARSSRARPRRLGTQPPAPPAAALAFVADAVVQAVVAGAARTRRPRVRAESRPSAAAAARLRRTRSAASALSCSSSARLASGRLCGEAHAARRLPSGRVRK